jgi:hypothetical protein
MKSVSETSTTTIPFLDRAVPENLQSATFAFG